MLCHAWFTYPQTNQVHIALRIWNSMWHITRRNDVKWGRMFSCSGAWLELPKGGLTTSRQSWEAVVDVCSTRFIVGVVANSGRGLCAEVDFNRLTDDDDKTYQFVKFIIQK